MRLLLYILALVLIVPAMAEPITIQAGPYNVSLDLGIAQGCYEFDRFFKYDPENGTYPDTIEDLNGDVHTSYDIIFFINKSCYSSEAHDQHINGSGIERYASISINETVTDNHNSYQSSPERLANFAQNYLKMGIIDCRNVQAATRKIDGTMGGIASGECEEYPRYIVYYVSPSEPLTRIEIISTYPWDEGTRQLLKTMHVEKRPEKTKA